MLYEMRDFVLKGFASGHEILESVAPAILTAGSWCYCSVLQRGDDDVRQSLV